jgi:2-polyprenyl-3-methyl-5-hydroxy-6-metoxy-1,4-benzoquinol methylase
VRLLVAIANHGTKNHKYVTHLIETYRHFSIDVDIVVLSDTPKDFGPDVEVRLGAPTSNPWSLPFAHRKLFVDRQDAYDLFIYSEDDTEITKAHVDAFVEATGHLPKDCIAGFIRYEEAPDGIRYYSTVHGPYYWDPNSMLTVGSHVYARYTNEHSACYLLTRNQLKACIASGGFDVPPHEGRYDMLCSAATDPYTRCGFQKVICISDIKSFLLHHLPDVYLGRIGVCADEIDAQITRMRELTRSDTPHGPLIPPRTLLDTVEFDKAYFEPYRPEIMALVPSAPSLRILSVGCERGLTEAKLVKTGHDVTAIPLDPVIAISAEMRGIRTTAADLHAAVTSLESERFDCLLFNNVLSHVADPPEMIRRVLPLLAARGFVIVAYRNTRTLGSLYRRCFRPRDPRTVIARPPPFGQSGFHPAHAACVRQWMRAVGLVPDGLAHHVPDTYASISRWLGGHADAWLSCDAAMRGCRG